VAPCDQSSIDRLVSSSPLATAVPDSAFCALKSTSCLLFVLGFVWCQIVSPVTSPNLSKPGTGNSTRDPQHLALSPSVGRISLAFLSSNFRVLCSLLASSLKRSGLRFRELEPSSPRPSNPTTLQDNSHCRRPQVPGTLFWRDGTLWATCSSSTAIGRHDPAVGCLIRACAGVHRSMIGEPERGIILSKPPSAAVRERATHIKNSVGHE